MGCYGPNAEYPVKWRREVKEWFKNNCNNQVKVINPTDFYEYGSNHHKTEKEIMRFELGILEKCDIVLVNLKDLNKSLGTSDEIKHAYDHNIPIIGFIETENELVGKQLYQFVHPWKVEQIMRIETGKDAMVKAMEYIRDYYIDC